ncbi:unnamed protein product [Notodromas monacha]|uniref:BPL/LPL catalytic domain-containing protein n=1 Tax=Notodromas monacha TaxID=399045 RepID=A0A7R9G9L9_9CRUS|nr:unnamed protein product [Notodromas monacha]CAG0913351.1 unnamed protein product [Notodromas monacha]
MAKKEDEWNGLSPHTRCEVLHQWLSDFRMSSPHASLLDLASGEAIAEALCQIDPDFFSPEWFTQISRDVSAENVPLKRRNLKKIVNKIKEGFMERFHFQLVGYQFPREDAILASDELELSKLLQMVLTFAVYCEKQEVFIDKIRQMEEFLQGAIMMAITNIQAHLEQLSYGQMPSLKANYPNASLQLQKAHDEERDLYLMCEELKQSLSQVREDNAKLASERDFLAKKLDELNRMVGGSPQSVPQLKQKIKELEDLLDKEFSGKETLGKSVGELERTNRQLQKTNSRLSEDIRALQDEVDVLREGREKLMTLEKSVATLSYAAEEVGSLRGVIKDLRGQLDEVLKDKIRLEEEAKVVPRIQSELDRVLADNKRLEKQVEDEASFSGRDRQELKQLKQRLEVVEKEKDALVVERSMLQQQVADLEGGGGGGGGGIGGGGLKFGGLLAETDPDTLEIIPIAVREKMLRLEHDVHQQASRIRQLEVELARTPGPVMDDCSARLQDLLDKKDLEIQEMEERYKKYLEKAKVIIRSLDSKHSVTAGGIVSSSSSTPVSSLMELNSLRMQVVQRDKTILALEEELAALKATKEMEERLMTTASRCLPGMSEWGTRRCRDKTPAFRLHSVSSGGGREAVTGVLRAAFKMSVMHARRKASPDAFFFTDILETRARVVFEAVSASLDKERYFLQSMTLDEAVRSPWQKECAFVILWTRKAPEMGDSFSELVPKLRDHLLDGGNVFIRASGGKDFIDVKEALIGTGGDGRFVDTGLNLFPERIVHLDVVSEDSFFLFRDSDADIQDGRNVTVAALNKAGFCCGHEYKEDAVEVEKYEPLAWFSESGALPRGNRFKLETRPFFTGALFSSDKYYAALKTRVIGRDVALTKLVSSTMDVVDDLQVPHGSAVIAELQNSGKGRGGNKWISPLGCAMFSLCLKVDLDSAVFKHASFVQHIAAVAVLKGLRALPLCEDLDVCLKWPNDIYLGDRSKIGGILVKTSVSGSSAVFNIGVGVNFLNELPTTSVKNALGEAGDQLQFEHYFASVFLEFERILEEIAVGNWAVREEYVNSMLMRGSVVEAQVGTGDAATMVAGTVEGIDGHGYLTMRLEHGEILSLFPDGNRFDITKGLIVHKLIDVDGSRENRDTCPCLLHPCLNGGEKQSNFEACLPSESRFGQVLRQQGAIGRSGLECVGESVHLVHQIADEVFAPHAWDPRQDPLAHCVKRYVASNLLRLSSLLKVIQTARPAKPADVESVLLRLETQLRTVVSSCPAVVAGVRDAMNVAKHDLICDTEVRQKALGSPTGALVATELELLAVELGSEYREDVESLRDCVRVLDALLLLQAPTVATGCKADPTTPLSSPSDSTLVLAEAMAKAKTVLQRERESAKQLQETLVAFKHAKAQKDRLLKERAEAVSAMDELICVAANMQKEQASVKETAWREFWTEDEARLELIRDFMSWKQ